MISVITIFQYPPPPAHQNWISTAWSASFGKAAFKRQTANTLDKWSSGAFSGFFEQEKRRTGKAHEKLLTGLREVMVGQSWTPPVGSIAERVRKEQALEACAQRLNLLTSVSKPVTSFKLSHASSA